MSEELTELEKLEEKLNILVESSCFHFAEDLAKPIIDTVKGLEEENKLLREDNENLDENYYDTWYACERLKENNNYALMFIDDIYCLVDTKDNKFEVIDNYKINNYGIIDNDAQLKLKALEIIKKKRVNIQALFYSSSCEDYNKHYNHYEDLTQEEYELLKEVLL